MDREPQPTGESPTRIFLQHSMDWVLEGQLFPDTYRKTKALAHNNEVFVFSRLFSWPESETLEQAQARAQAEWAKRGLNARIVPEAALDVAGNPVVPPKGQKIAGIFISLPPKAG